MRTQHVASFARDEVDDSEFAAVFAVNFISLLCKKKKRKSHTILYTIRNLKVAEYL